MSITSAQAEEALRQHRENLEKLVEKRTTELNQTMGHTNRLKQQIEVILGAAKTGLDIIDSELNIRYIDTEWKKVYGDPEGRKCYEYFMGRSDACPDCGVPKALATKQVTVTEKVMPKESNRHAQVTMVPFQDEKGNWLVAEVNVDISERKRAEAEKAELEAQYRQLQKAESLGRMAGAIAHTFNNQLGVVIGNLELAMMELSQGASPHAKITAAMKASNRAAEVSGLMLTYLGQSFDKRESLDLSDACLRGLPVLRAVIPGDVVLETDLPSPGPAISANANEIQQVLTNLITNAWEAVGKSRGAIHLNIKTVSPSEIPASHRFPIGWQPQDHAYACMEAADAGCGIEDKDIEKLFDPFFTSKFTGRGLGLPVVLGIVKAHGGAVTVESEPNRGSTFRVFLPVSGEEVPRQPNKGNCGDTLQQGVPTIASPMKMEGSVTVLLVEDEEMVREMAADMLKSLGFSVLEAKDGVEAVEVFRQRQEEIRCVLCDLTMPRMNGWETLTALRKLAPDIPVILASGYDKDQVMAGDHPEWPQVFLGKPYKLKGLSDAIGQAWVNKKK